MQGHWSKAIVSLALIGGLAGCASSNSASSTPGRSGTSGSGTATKSTIVLGNVGNYTSSFGPQYRQSADGLQAWASWVNENGGLNGHPVKVIVLDDQNNPGASLADVKQLVEADHVAALVGMMTAGTDSAWSAYVQQKQIPVIGGISLDANWLTNPYFFSTNVTPVSFLTGQFAAAKSYGTSAGVMYCAELAACKAGVPLFPQIAQAVGVKFAGSQAVSASAPDYSAPCLALRGAGADVVLPELDGPTGVKVIDSCAQQGYKPAAVVTASDIDAATLKDPAFNNAIGVTVSPLWFGSSPLTEQFFTAFAKQNPGVVPNGYSTLGWQAGMVVSAVLAHAPATVTPNTVLQGLWAQPAKDTYSGWTPPLTYTKGKPATTSSCLWYVQIKNGQLTAPKGPNFVCGS